jgi:colanic acid biosynthesis glycosyl transferase WcaI
LNDPAKRNSFGLEEALLRAAVCDYSGHPFQAQLSRELARRGHDVLHLHFDGFQTPKGRLSLDPADSPNLAFAPISLDQPFAKYSYIRRRFQEIEVGRRIARRLVAFRPDVVLACNLPLDSLDQLVRSCGASATPFVFWQQDIYSRAIGRILARKFGWLGSVAGAYYHRMEAHALAAGAAVIVIADEFSDALVQDFGIASEKIHVIENWAPLDEIKPSAKSNAWSRDLGFDGAEIVLYTGTLGMKHDPAHILGLGEALRTRPQTKLVVTSEGLVADWIASQARERALHNLRVLPFQPFAVYSQVLSAADVLIALLDKDSGGFSVPSKILSYLCAGRPTVLSAPSDNLASRIIKNSGSGIVVAPDDTPGFVNAVRSMLDDPPARDLAARNARNFAERSFAIEPIAARFENILTLAAKQHSRRSSIPQETGVSRKALRFLKRGPAGL